MRPHKGKCGTSLTYASVRSLNSGLMCRVYMVDVVAAATFLLRLWLVHPPDSALAATFGTSHGCGFLRYNSRDDHFEMKSGAVGTTWSCIFLSTDAADASSGYRHVVGSVQRRALDVTFRNHRPNGVGNLGVIFNVRDKEQYDYVYVSLSNSKYYLGFVSGGRATLTKEGSCPTSLPVSSIWFHVKVHVKTTGLVTLYVNDDYVTTTAFKHAIRGRLGVLVSNGHGNTIHFRYPDLRKFGVFYARDYVATSCGGRLVEHEVGEENLVVTADGTDTFCRVLANAATVAREFEVKVRVLIGDAANQRGGEVGVLFNAENEDEFDYILIKYNTTNVCRIKGYVQLGQDHSSTTVCSAGALAARRWRQFTIRVNNWNVEVIVTGIVRTAVTLNARFPPGGQVGILVRNGQLYSAKFSYIELAPANTVSLAGYVSAGCRSHLVDNVLGRIELNGNVATSSLGQRLCRILSAPTYEGLAYAVTASLYNALGNGQTTHGNLGIIYNAVDNNNFDLVNIRVHDTTDCYHAGYVRGTTLTLNTSNVGQCPAHPASSTWFTVRVDTREYGETRLYVNNRETTILHPHFITRGDVGTFVFSGQNNVAYFREPLVQVLPVDYSASYVSTNCRIDPGVVIIATDGKMMMAGRSGETSYCNILLEGDLRSPAYDVTALIYLDSGSTGTAGVLYNRRRQNANADYILFTIGSSTACYDVGYFTGQGRNVPLRSSASCPGNQQLNLGTWINVTIAWRLIIARVYLDGTQLLGTFSSHWTGAGRFGVFTRNDVGNRVHFQPLVTTRRPVQSASGIEGSGCLDGLRVLVVFEGRALRGRPNKPRGYPFCRAVLARPTNWNAYDFRARLYSLRGRSKGAHILGLMMNVHNWTDSDYVLTRGVALFCNTVVAGQAGVPSRSRTVVAGQAGVPSRSRTVVVGHAGVPSRSRTVVVSHAGVPSRSRTVVVGHAGVPSRSRTVVVGHAGVPSRNRTVAVGHAGVPSRNRTVVVGHTGVPSRNRTVAVGHAGVPSRSRTVVVGHAGVSSRNRTFVVGQAGVPSRNRTVVVVQAGVPSRNRTVVVGQTGVPSRNRTVVVGHAGVPSRSRTVVVGHAGVSSRNRTVVVGQAGVPSRNRTVVVVQAGVPSRNRTVVVGQTGVPSRNRTVVVGHAGVTSRSRTVVVGHAGVPSRNRTVVVGRIEAERINDPSRCYETGYFVGGKAYTAEEYTGPCPSLTQAQKPMVTQFFKMTVKVRAQIASIHINNNMLAVIAPRQTARQSVGWLTPNGYGNIIIWQQYGVSRRRVITGMTP
ncbi:putative skeletal organic matrix protein 7 [Lamellibrachia satsuma]|nr:putative skeletal organic matrix protein 7 [Lamellibrachia satsuma]